MARPERSRSSCTVRATRAARERRPSRMRETVNGNGSFQSGAFTPTLAGTYRWVVDYSGDANNESAGPTACGADSETVVVSKATPSLSSTASGGALQPRRARGAAGRTARAPQPMYDTADLEGGFAPTGTITFQLYGPDDPSCSGRCDLQLDGSGSRQRLLQLRSVHADPRGDLSVARELFRGCQQPTGGPDWLRRSQ